jgi:hydroxymethylpyrimidine/phosphomethylpyrimidine kinase
MKSGGLPPPLVVAIGGVDPSGGAGIVRDALTAAALGARAYTVGTAWTEQGEGVHSVERREPTKLENAVRQAIASGPDAIKIGMLPDAGAVAAVARALAGAPAPIVVDPVLASSRGGLLFAGEPRELLPLLRRATLVTPNAPEAAALTGRPVASAAEAEAAARALAADGVPAVLVKGGHIGHSGDVVVDLLHTAAGTRAFSRERVAGPSPRGTGCALATAIAVGLGRGAPLEDAIDEATAWLARAIAAAIDAGHGQRHLPL